MTHANTKSQHDGRITNARAFPDGDAVNDLIEVITYLDDLVTAERAAHKSEVEDLKAEIEQLEDDLQEARDRDE